MADNKYSKNDYFECDLAYGSGVQHLKFHHSRLLKLATPPNPIEPAKDDRKEIRRSIENPIGAPRLKTIAAPGKTAVVIVTDQTRPTPLKKIIPLLLEELLGAGVSAKDITILFAPGTHRPSTVNEMKACVGDEVFSQIRCQSHDSEQMDGIVSLGTSSLGTPIELNRIAVEADIRICVNMVEPHHSAGWSGGAKNIMPGIASKRSVFQHHSLSANPGVEIGRIAGNPFKEDIDEIGKFFGVDFSVDVVLTEKFELIRSFAGGLIEANHAAAKYAEKLLLVKIPRPAEIVIGSVGGAPRDKTFWQAEGKNLIRVSPVVREKGIVILVAECAEGFGDPRFGEILNSGTPADIIENFSKQDYTVLGNKAFRFAKLMQKASVYFVTKGIQQEQLQTLPVRFFPNLQEAVDHAVAQMDRDAGILVVPNTAAVLLKATV